MPKVSVIIPTYNSGGYLGETLLSVLAQGYQDIEVIVVDDASTDNTAEVVANLNSDKITYLVLPQNHGGPSKARNVGVKNAQGEYIAIFDSDDLMFPGRIGSVVSHMDEHPEVGMVCTDAVKFNDITGDYPYNHVNPKHYNRFNSLKTRCAGTDFYIIDKKQAYKCLFHENYVQTSSVTIRKSVFDDVGYFDESLTNADDWDMWFRITSCFDLGYLDEICVRYRMREGSITTKAAKKLGINKVKVLRKQLESNPDADIRRRAHTLISIFYAEMGYSFRCENQMEQAREYYMMSLKEKPDWTVFVHWLISQCDFNTINSFKDISLLRKIKSLVTVQREHA